MDAVPVRWRLDGGLEAAWIAAGPASGKPGQRIMVTRNRRDRLPPAGSTLPVSA